MDFVLTAFAPHTCTSPTVSIANAAALCIYCLVCRPNFISYFCSVNCCGPLRFSSISQLTTSYRSTRSSSRFDYKMPNTRPHAHAAALAKKRLSKAASGKGSGSDNDFKTDVTGQQQSEDDDEEDDESELSAGMSSCTLTQIALTDITSEGPTPTGPRASSRKAPPTKQPAGRVRKHVKKSKGAGKKSKGAGKKRGAKAMKPTKTAGEKYKDSKSLDSYSHGFCSCGFRGLIFILLDEEDSGSVSLPRISYKRSSHHGNNASKALKASKAKAKLVVSAHDLASNFEGLLVFDRVHADLSMPEQEDLGPAMMLYNKIKNHIEARDWAKHLPSILPRLMDELVKLPVVDGRDFTFFYTEDAGVGKAKRGEVLYWNLIIRHASSRNYTTSGVKTMSIERSQFSQPSDALRWAQRVYVLINRWPTAMNVADANSPKAELHLFSQLALMSLGIEFKHVVKRPLPVQAKAGLVYRCYFTLLTTASSSDQGEGPAYHHDKCFDLIVGNRYDIFVSAPDGQQMSKCATARTTSAQ